VTIFGALTLLAASLFAAPLPNDTRILTGKLDNGVTWLYRQHNNPPGKMAFMMHVRTGSLNETDAQRGLAHFMEHMAFNGTEHFPPGKLVPYFESVGMTYGAHLNAYTSFDQTVYMLFTPDTKAEQIDKALMVLSDYAFGGSLLEAEINKERGIILEESRSRKSASQRIQDKLWPDLFEGTRFAVRLPIGEEKIISSVPRDEFVDYYRTWYRPENVTLFMVGDAAPDAYLPLIQKWFGEYKPDRPARQQMTAEFKPFTKERALVVTDPEMAYCEVELITLRPGRPPVVTVEQWRTQLVEYLGSWIIGRRYDERVKKGEASYRNAGAQVQNFFNDAMSASAFATGEPKDWAKMLEEVVVEVNRVRQYGFTSRELALARKEILASAERAVRTETTQNARQLISTMVSAVNNRVPILSAEQRFELYQQLLPSIQLSEVESAFKENFKPGAFAYVLTMADKESVKAPSREELLASANAAWQRSVEKPKEDAASATLLTELPKAGKVIKKSLDKDLQITSGWLANGVRFHHRFMDYKKDSVLVSISLAGGDIEETAANAGVTQVAQLAVDEAATRRLDSTKIRDLMTGKNISVAASSGDDAFVITVSGSPRDLESGLQEAYALLTDGIIEESAFKNWRLNQLREIEMREKMPQFRAYEAMADLLSGGDPRETYLTKPRVEALTREQGQAWFERLCREAPIEVAVVGDITLEDALSLTERYVGSLPKRSRSARALDKLRRLPRPPGPLERNVPVETVTPKAMALAGFVGPHGSKTSDARALSVAANILSSRLVKRIREELAIVYSIGASSWPSWVYQDAGRFASGAPCYPANASKVTDEVHKSFQEFAEQGPTEEELTNAKKQIANTLDTELREPTYWWSLLRHYDLHQRDLKAVKTIKQDYARFTAAQIRDVFRKYYAPTRTFSVTAVPVVPRSVDKETPAVQSR
jgi:zinc protease